MESEADGGVLSVSQSKSIMVRDPPSIQLIVAGMLEPEISGGVPKQVWSVDMTAPLSYSACQMPRQRQPTPECKSCRVTYRKSHCLTSNRRR